MTGSIEKLNPRKKKTGSGGNFFPSDSGLSVWLV